MSTDVSRTDQAPGDALPSGGASSENGADEAAARAAVAAELDAIETEEWRQSLHDVFFRRGPDRVAALLQALQLEAQKEMAPLPVTSKTPYVNTIPLARQPPYPGNRDIERRIKSLVRWNAMAMVVEANTKADGIGGHISTYASAATLYEVAFNHFLRGGDHPSGGDLVYIQGHASPGIYARAYLEGRLTPQQLHNFRRELAEGGGLPSYPHPWLMHDFWKFPTVSMGLGPLMAIYQARFMRYLVDRGIKEPSDAKVWAFIGDGETDEPESLGAISLAARERLDNLIFVINCNLQRLDGPVRGNGQIIQELEAVFRGAGWNVVKALWGSEWDPLLAQDHDGLLATRMGEVVDGEYQKYTVAGGAYIREHFYGVDPRLLRMVEHMSDDELWAMRLGGHDPEKVYAAFHAAVQHAGAPTVVLARTIKGYGLGEAGEGKNITHQQKKLNEDELMEFRDRFEIPLTDEEVVSAPLYRPSEDSAEARYLQDRRRALGGYLPQRRTISCAGLSPAEEIYSEFFEGTGERDATTTLAFVRLLNNLMRDETIGEHIVPIVPDEARTFGMEPLFRQAGIYSHVGQLYEPVDADSLIYYKETTDGQILEEGITEAGSLASFIAAGTAAAVHGACMLPVFIFYSMFGFQRVGDLIWAAADSRTRGFLVGATAGRTTLQGEGLQHQDGHSHVLSSVVPNLLSYDPAYAYEIAVIVREGIRRMHELQDAVFYYLTVTNEAYRQPPMPDGVEDGIIHGMYGLRRAEVEGPHVQLLGSGAILNEVIEAQRILEGYGVAADVWSVTSYSELRRDALDADRWNMLHPGEPPRRSYLAELTAGAEGPFVAATDYLKSLPDAVAKWLPGRLVSLGTDGFGRSETREALRDFFEVDAKHVVLAALWALAEEGAVDAGLPARAIAELGIDPEKANPRLA
jgi:pyruvate dehydrogenase E1 component